MKIAPFRLHLTLNLKMKTYYLIMLCLLMGINPIIHGQTLSQKNLDHLIARAEGANSDGMVIYYQQELVGSWYFDKSPQLVDIKSVTKSITNLAIGYLVSSGKLQIDQPVSDYYPEWAQENKSDITIRHLLAHTSGLLDSEFSLVEETANIVDFALASDLSHPVGKFHVYNNKAVNLLAGIIEKADGRKLDQLMKEEIFTPLGISDYQWPTDQIGNPYVMAFLKLYPEDLAKIGQLALNRGNWQGRQLIDEQWFVQSTKPASDQIPHYGLLWELLTDDFKRVVDEKQISALRDAGVDEAFIEKARQMIGEYQSYREYYGKVREVYGGDFSQVFQKKLIPYGVALARFQTDGNWGYAGIGYLGQYLVIYPEHQLVAVRLINHYPEYNWDTDEFTEFPELVKSLIQE